ncbi:FecR protein [Pedobacter cryoconitis]|uniref:FecR protein n=1 Tax=Pedobacter cryoconitis TaxID=188932 RepID=A0A127VF19_9SPHI|nr:FecR family protein [Pedobacter cryoconitis]AMP99811.1 FecR protein [Pedobacter cryoconitis]
MDKLDKRTQQLLDKYHQGKCSPEEMQQLVQVYHFASLSADPGDINNEALLETGKRIWSKLPAAQLLKPQLRRTVRLKQWAAAAAAIAAIVFGIWFFTGRPIVNRNSQIVHQKDIKPGKNTATLTLSSGKTINLSDTKTGVVIDASNLRYDDGSLVNTTSTTPPVGHSSLAGGELQGADRSGANWYDAGRRFAGRLSASSPPFEGGVPEGGGGKMQNFTLSTPRGGTYQVKLPDGSKVWLNAASSLTYTAPLNRAGVRKATLTGEAYFQIAKNKAHPFIVETGKQQVEVLGTHFNINSYADEPAITTTLEEGSIKVNSDGFAKILKPGQQSTATANNITVKSVNVKNVIAWKDGDFLFEEESLGSIMRKVSRWYDVEVVFQNVDQHELYGGGVSRYDNISKVLENLELTGGLHFKIERRTIIVMK